MLSVSLNKTFPSFIHITIGFQTRNPKFLRAVEHSRHFYLLNLLEDSGDSFKDVTTSVIEEGVRKGDYCASIVSMNNSFYWHRMLLEDATYGHPCVEIQLGVLRSYIYRLVLPKHKHFVTEHGRTPWEEMRQATVSTVVGCWVQRSEM